MLKIDDLQRLFNESQNVDRELFAEQRSNLLLVAGEHYTKKNTKFWNRVRDNKDITTDQKLRLTKNHIQKITKTLTNNILSYCPGVTITPDIDNEIQDQKTAELNLAVWRHAKQQQRMAEKQREWAQTFIEAGETAVKIFWDETKGRFLGFNGQVDEDGAPVLDPETGEQAPDEKSPAFSGEFVFEKIFPANLMRAASAKTMRDSPYLIYVKMASKKDLMKLFPDKTDPRSKFLVEGGDKTFLVFEATQSKYNTTSDEVLIQEFYFRPCMQYPQGYYYIATEEGILFEGELPFGLFPIIYAGFDHIDTSPRAHAIIKHLRPYQIEINRCASAMATHQITLGDDKIITGGGAKIDPGGFMPGVRLLKSSGSPIVTTIPGRSGEQYLPYMNDQITEMYAIANVQEDSQDRNAQVDPYVMLYQSVKDKKKFSLYSDKFEQFLVDVCELYLQLAKQYLPDDELIPAIGRREYVNLAEFRSMEPLGYRIKVEPQSDNIESMLGKQIVLNHALQYVGGSLGKDDIGRILKNMPFANMDETFDDLTIDYENAKNDVLALDRGEMPIFNEKDNHAYIIKKLVHRMKAADYQLLSEEIKHNYETFLQVHSQLEAMEQQKIQQAEAGFIPTGGYMVKADFYVNKDGKNERALFPYEALSWLTKKLEQQGLAQADMMNMQQSAMADVADKLAGMNAQNNGAVDPAQLGGMQNVS